MSTFKRIILSLLLISSLMLLSPKPALACTCAGFLTPEDELRHSTAVFTGKVLDVRGPLFRDPEDLEPLRVTFEVYEVWKGPVENRLVSFTSGHSESCGYEFSEGKEYLVYADGTEDRLTVYSCSRTSQLLYARDDVAALGSGTVPDSSALDAPWIPVILLSSLGLGIFATFLLWQHFKAPRKDPNRSI